MAETAEELRFAPEELGFIADPYPVYAHLREHTPVLYDEATDHYLISRHEDVNALLRDRRFGRTYLHQATHAEMGHPGPPGWHDPFWNLINAGILDMEPPDHTRVRRLVSKPSRRSTSRGFGRGCRRSWTGWWTGSPGRASSTCSPRSPSRCR